MSYNIDWNQYKRNLEKEREEWSMFEIRRQIIEERMLQAIEAKREEFEAFKIKKKTEYEKLVKKAHKEYMKQVEKEFKPSVK
jgi:hypothetical protein